MTESSFNVIPEATVFQIVVEVTGPLTQIPYRTVQLVPTRATVTIGLSGGEITAKSLLLEGWRAKKDGSVSRQPASAEYWPGRGYGPTTPEWLYPVVTAAKRAVYGYLAQGGQ